MTRRTKLSVLLGTILCCAAAQSYAQTDTLNSAGNGGPDKLPARQTWEYAVSAPTVTAVSPAVGLLKGMEATTAFIYSREIGLTIYHALVSADGSRIIYPFYSTRVGLGLQYLKKDLINLGSRLRVRGSYGFLNRGTAGLSFMNLKIASWGPNPLYTGAAAEFRTIPDERFFGIGNDSESDNKTNYRLQSIGFMLPFEYDHGRHISLFAVPSLFRYKTSDPGGDLTPIQDKFAPSEVPGFSTTAWIGDLISVATFDWLDSEFRPARGFLGKASLGISDEATWISEESRDPFGFWLALAGVSGFFEMPWGPHRVLVLQAEIESREDFSDRVIPFYLLSQFGGRETIRGFVRSRYMDKKRLLGTVEYRYPVWIFARGVMDAFFFADAGQVASEISDFGFGRFHPGGGFGLHLYVKDRPAGLLSFAFSKDEFEFRLALE